VRRYTVHVTPQAWNEMKDLPGNLRQRVRREVDALADSPRPAHSKTLEVPLRSPYEVRRLRLDRWRVVYRISKREDTIDVLAVRKRPPYDYGDLQQMLQEAR
jgi:mRNA-degrading endonuclease RelE of RelBE toxin-antitoxin system